MSAKFPRGGGSRTFFSSKSTGFTFPHSGFFDFIFRFSGFRNLNRYDNSVLCLGEIIFQKVPLNARSDLDLKSAYSAYEANLLSGYIF